MSPDSDSILRGKLEQILQAEAPISKSLLVQRLLRSCGISRATAPLAARIEKLAEGTGAVCELENGVWFYWRPDQNRSDYRVFRCAEGEEKRQAQDLPAVEIINAIVYILTRTGELSGEDLLREVSKELGYTRRGNALSDAIWKAVMVAKKENRITGKADGSCSLPE